MTLNDTLSNALSHLNNSEKSGKEYCEIKNSSKLIIEVLKILKKYNYIENYESKKTNQGEFTTVHLKSAINKCGSIKPRFPTQLSEFEKFERRYLPANNFGIIIVSTSKGIMTHNEAIKNRLGGKLIAYCY